MVTLAEGVFCFWHAMFRTDAARATRMTVSVMLISLSTTFLSVTMTCMLISLSNSFLGMAMTGMLIAIFIMVVMIIVGVPFFAEEIVRFTLMILIMIIVVGMIMSIATALSNRLLDMFVTVGVEKLHSYVAADHNKNRDRR
jgi:hypothetical protein